MILRHLSQRNCSYKQKYKRDAASASQTLVRGHATAVTSLAFAAAVHWVCLQTEQYCVFFHEDLHFMHPPFSQLLDLDVDLHIQSRSKQPSQSLSEVIDSLVSIVYLLFQHLRVCTVYLHVSLVVLLLERQWPEPIKQIAPLGFSGEGLRTARSGGGGRCYHAPPSPFFSLPSLPSQHK